MIKNYLKSYLYLILSIISLSIILSILNYFTNKPLLILKTIIPIISISISSIILGKNSKEKAYLEGIKYSTIFLILISIIKLIFKNPFTIKTIILYILIIITSIISSTIGIHLKKET